MPTARDLVSRMTLKEKAGAMMHGTLAAVDHPLGLSTLGYDFAAMEPKITQRPRSEGRSDPTNSHSVSDKLPRPMTAPQRAALNQNTSYMGIPMTLLSTGPNVWLEGILKEIAIASGLTIAESPETADIALVRLSPPFEKSHPNYFFGRMQNEGRLDFRPGEAGHDLFKSLSAKTRVAVALFADRPEVLGDVNSMASAILVNFGVSDAALLDVMTGNAKAKGRLPFELPSSMEAVAAQDPAKADDSNKPLYPAGHEIVK